MGYRSPTALTASTPSELALYREDHRIEAVDGRCAHDGIEVIRRGFYGWLHHPDEIRRLARIERGGEA